MGCRRELPNSATSFKMCIRDSPYPGSYRCHFWHCCWPFDANGVKTEQTRYVIMKYPYLDKIQKNGDVKKMCIRDSCRNGAENLLSTGIDKGGNVMKKLISFAVAGMLALSLAACGSSSSAAASSTESSAESTAASTADSAAADSDLAYLQNKGKMTIGYTVYEPMNYTDESGTFTGFDTELATAVCEKLGVEPDFVEINWDTKETELAAKSIDCIWNGLTLTDDREANMACTKPYVKNAQVVVMKADADYTSTADLAGKTVVAESGSAGELSLIHICIRCIGGFLPAVQRYHNNGFACAVHGTDQGGKAGFQLLFILRCRRCV